MNTTESVEKNTQANGKNRTDVVKW